MKLLLPIFMVFWLFTAGCAVTVNFGGTVAINESAKTGNNQLASGDDTYPLAPVGEKEPLNHGIKSMGSIK